MKKEDSFAGRLPPSFRARRTHSPESLDSLLRGLEQGDDMQVLQALSALSMDLAVASEEILDSFPVEQLVRALLQSMQKDYIADLVLFAITCVTNLLDLAPSLAGLAVHMGAIPLLASKLANFEFIDLAEHAVKALKKISTEHSAAVLKEGAFGTMVQLIDFFENDCQRLIVAIALNVAKGLAGRDAYQDSLVPCLGAMLGLLDDRGADHLAFNEKALEFFICLVDSLNRVYHTDTGELQTEVDALNTRGLLKRVVVLVNAANTLRVKGLKLLRGLCRCSAGACAAFIVLGGLALLKDALGCLQQPGQLQPGVLEAFGVVDCVLPGTQDSPVDPVECGKRRLFEARPGDLEVLGELVLPKVIYVFEHLASRTLRRVALEILEKLVSISPTQLTLKYVHTESFATFIAELLGSEDHCTVRVTLEVLAVLYEKVPQDIAHSFTREGVVARVQEFKTPETIRQLRQSETHLNLDAAHPLRRLLTNPGELDPVMFEELMNTLRRNREHSRLPEEPLTRNSTSERDESSHRILMLSKKILSKHSKVEHKRALHTCKELAKLTGELSAATGYSCTALWGRLLTVLEQENLSCFEVTQSGLALAMWGWLNTEHSAVAVARLEDFLSVFLKEHRPQLGHLVGILISCVRFVRNFAVTVNEFTHPLLRRASKVKVLFVYCVSNTVLPPELESEYQWRHSLFTAHKKFSVVLESDVALAMVKQQLLRVRTREEIDNLKLLFRSGESKATQQGLEFQHLLQMGLNSEEAMNELEGGQKDAELVVPVKRNSNELNCKLGVQLQVHSKVLRKGMKLGDVASNETLTLHFRFGKTEESKTVLLSKPELILRDLLQQSADTGLDHSDKAAVYIKLVKLVFSLNEYLPNLVLPSSLVLGAVAPQGVPKQLPLSTFCSGKLTALLDRQLVSPPLPPSSWLQTLPKACKFFFPFHTRCEYLYVAELGCHRLFEGRHVVKHRVSVFRNSLLENAMFIFADTALLRQGPLDIEYDGEVGTGQGPTLEFYNLLSQEIRCLKLWRANQEEGLFPVPLQVADCRALEYFETIGRVVGKAILDKRQLDLPFNAVWWKLVLEYPLTVLDVQTVDKALGKFLLEFQELVNKRENNHTTVLFKGVEVESLGISFTLPGHDELELRPNGRNTAVTLDNLEEYIQLTAERILLQSPQSQAFRRGLESLLPLGGLQVLQPSEFELLLCGDSKESWELDVLQQHIRADHGYSCSSRTFQNLLIFMNSLEPTAKRDFLSFLTGSPRLPLGGFAKLSPKLRVVKKDPSLPGHLPDEYLPSVMTCQNYLKVPDYSSYEVLHRQMTYAMAEGFQAFHLS